MKLDEYHDKSSRASCLDQIGFAAFGNGEELIGPSMLTPHNLCDCPRHVTFLPSRDDK